MPLSIENMPLNTLNVLAVDDEVFNLEILSEWLTDWGVNVDTAENGEQALSLLDAGERRYHTLLLDRMMPGMDGFKLLEAVKQRPDFKNIPVVMQSAAATTDEIQYAFTQGVWYYLCKPFERRKLCTLIESAMADAIIHTQLRNDVKNLNSPPQVPIELPFLEVRTLTEVREAALMLARFTANPEKVVVGLYELLLNAVEHGNLEISYNEKTRLLNEHAWKEEIADRLDQAPYCDRKAGVTFNADGQVIQFLIKDQGKGFKCEPYLQLQTHRAGDNHGRGIAIANNCSFTHLKYQDGGSEVLAVTNLMAEKAA